MWDSVEAPPSAAREKPSQILPKDSQLTGDVDAAVPQAPAGSAAPAGASSHSWALRRTGVGVRSHTHSVAPGPRSVKRRGGQGTIRRSSQTKAQFQLCYLLAA